MVFGGYLTFIRKFLFYIDQMTSVISADQWFGDGGQEVCLESQTILELATVHPNKHLFVIYTQSVTMKTTARLYFLL